MRASVQRLPARFADKATNKGGNSRLQKLCWPELQSFTQCCGSKPLRVRQAPASFDVKLKISKLSIYDLFSLFLIWLRVLAELQMVRCITTLNSGCNITIGHKLTGQSAQIQFVQKIEDECL